MDKTSDIIAPPVILKIVELFLYFVEYHTKINVKKYMKTGVFRVIRIPTIHSFYKKG